MPSWVRSSLSPPSQEKGAGPAPDHPVVPRHQSFLRVAAAAGGQLAQRFIAALVQGLGRLLVRTVHIVLYLSIK